MAKELRPKIFITGSSGYLGYFITKRLSETYTLICQARDRNRIPSCSQPHTVHTCVDLLDLQALTACMAGVDYVIHLAYDHIPGQYRNGEGDDLVGWYQKNLNFQLNLLLASQASSVKGFIYLSSRAVYDTTQPVIDEESPLHPDSHYGALKAASELLMDGFPFKHVALRSTGVYGVVKPVERSKWFSLIQQLLKEKCLLSDRISSELHGDDLARLIETLLVIKDWPRFINVSDIVVSHAMIAKQLELEKGITIQIDHQLEQMQGQMKSSYLEKIGFQFSGMTAWTQTIRQLVMNHE
jgi:nucleoside-diphosphate-sugar epimerase